MSAESETLEHMRQAIASLPTPTPTPKPLNGEYVATAFTAVGHSVVSDPMFYVKSLSVLLLTLVILFISFELISSGG